MLTKRKSITAIINITTTLQPSCFISNAPTQTAETMHSLRIADIVIPSLTAAIAIWIMYKYSLNETRAREIKAELVERRGEL